MIGQDSSRRLNLLRFPAIIGILYIHAFGTTISFTNTTLGRADNDALTDGLRILISQCLARIAVPLFFLLSGYLFFANFRWSPQGYLRKIYRRAQSLLIPYLFWNSLMLIMTLLSQTIPVIGPYFPEGALMLGKYSPYEYTNALLGLSRYPIAYHMWFIRDLICLVLLVPILVVVLRFAALPFFLLVYYCWVRESWPVLTPGAVGVLFFSAGAFCATKKKSLFCLDRFGPAALLASLPIIMADVIYYSAWFHRYLHRTGLIIEVIAVLYITKIVARQDRLSENITALGGASFFVYAAHEPLLGLLRTLTYQYLPLNGPYTILLLYLITPMIVVFTLLLAHKILSKTCPYPLSIITGGR
ncbi:MAG: acyltransferase [Desulfobulbaceae bacterium]|nr:acyltransferase [Desulfobulbaceae bacterium]